MIYHTGCDAHNKTCNFQHISDDGAIGLKMRVNTNEDSIHRFLDLFLCSRLPWIFILGIKWGGICIPMGELGAKILTNELYYPVY